MRTLHLSLLLLLAAGILLAEGRTHHKRHHGKHHDSDESEHHDSDSHHDSDESKHHDSDSDSHHDSDESKHHDSDSDSHHDSDESEHHDSDEHHDDSDEHHGGKHRKVGKVVQLHHYYDQVKKFLNFGGKIKVHKGDHHDDSDEHHDDSDEHHGRHRRHHGHHDDSDESHHDSDESHHDSDEHHDDSDEHHGHHRRHHGHHRRHHDSDESHHDSDEHHDDSDEHHGGKHLKGAKVVQKHFYHDKVKKFINFGGKVNVHKGDDSNEHHDDSDEHHGHHRRHHGHHDDSDESHHDSDESHHDSDEDHSDEDGKHRKVGKVIQKHYYYGTVKKFINFGGKIKVNKGDHDESDEGHHDDSDEHHHDSDESHHDSDESHHDSDEHHDDSDEHHGHHRRHHGHHRRHHDSDESHHDSDESHHDSDESHHDSDESHHDSDESHHDSDESHHDSDEHHGHHRRHHGRHRRHHDSDESHHDSDESHGSDEDDHDEHHVYHFHIGEGFGPYEYIDPSTGFLKGFDVDLLHEVCHTAHKECYYTLDTDEHCWHTSGQHELPGRGLLDGWYDGCVGLAPTPERLNSFNFTLSHAPNIKASLHFRSGEVPAQKDLTGKKVGFVSGWAFSRSCLARQSLWSGNTVPAYTAFMYEDHDDMVAALLKKEVDAIMTTETADLSKKGIVASDSWFYCSNAGPAVMVRKGDHVVDWWNHALEKMVSSGKYRRLCQQARDKHGAQGKIFCLDD